MELASYGVGQEESVERAYRSVLLDQAAQLLGVSRRTIYNRIREGRLTTIRTRCGSQRVLLDSLERLLREMQLRETRRRARGPKLHAEAVPFQV
jgi:excisionase family DNA binding protein